MTPSAMSERHSGIDSAFADLVEELTARFQSGEAVDGEALLRDHPEYAEQLKELLPALALLANLSQSGQPLDIGHGPMGELGDFRLIREVGRGGMGVVYEAEQLSLNRRVALKVLPFAATMDPRQLLRFQNEAKAAASLRHENIVHVYGVGCERGVHFYAMEFVDGQTLAEAIAEQRGDISGSLPPCGGGLGWGVAAPAPSPPAPLPQGERGVRETVAALTTKRDKSHFRHIAELVARAADALEHAHSMGIVHRDVKPGNLLLDNAGKVYVSDFGLARFGPDAGMTVTGDVIGTLRYMSPEQALAKHGLVDHRTDVYSLGATLYELLTLRPAVDGADKQEILQRIAFEEPISLTRIDKSIPGELETITLKALSKEVGERYATAAEFADDLRRWLGDQAIKARPPGVRQKVTKWARRHAAAVWAGFITAAVIVAGVAAVAADYHARRQASEQAVGSALNEADAFQQLGKYAEALSAARRADGLIGGGAVSQDLKEEVQRRCRDLELVLRLDEARLDGSAVKDGRFDYGLTDRRFAEEFRNADIDVEGATADQTAALIRATSVPRELAGVLDDWALRRRKNQGHTGRDWTHLLAVASAADPEESRDRFRKALATGRKDAVLELAATTKTLKHSLWSLVALGRALCELNEPKAAIEVLNEAQRINPNDFWTNHWLGWAYEFSTPPRHEEAIRFWTVAVALRPESPGARVNLGSALHRHGRHAEAIVNYREAIRLKPDYTGAYTSLTFVLTSSGRTEDAFDVAREAVRLQPGDASRRADLARVHMELGIFLRSQQGKNQEGEAHLRQDLALRKQLRDEFPDNLDFAVSLGGACANIGTILLMTNRLEQSLEYFQLAIQELTSVQKEPVKTKSRQFLRNSFKGRSTALMALKRFEEALRDCEEALNLDDGSLRVTLIVQRAVCLSHIDWARAVADIEGILLIAKLAADDLYKAALVYAVANAKEKDNALQERYAVRAVELLRKAQAAGHFKEPNAVANLKTETDLDSLRNREDFRKFLETLEGKTKR